MWPENISIELIFSILGRDRRKYSGPTGWILAFHVDDSVWKITSPINENTSIILKDNNFLPVGKKLWTLPESSCNKGLDEERVLLLTSCNLVNSAVIMQSALPLQTDVMELHNAGILVMKNLADL